MAKHYITTPFAPVVWASLNKPGKPYDDDAKPKFELRLGATEAQMTKFSADIMAMIGQVTFKGKKPKIGISVSEDGTRTIYPTSLYKPLIVDSKAQPVLNARIANGSVVRAKCELNVHEKGVGLRLIEVQIKSLVEYAAADPDGPRKSSMDSIEDGYVAGEAGEPAEDEAGTTTGTSALDI